MSKPSLRQIKKFVYKDKSHPQLLNPFRQKFSDGNTYTCATNGHILVAVRDNENIHNIENKPKAEFGKPPNVEKVIPPEEERREFDRYRIPTSALREFAGLDKSEDTRPAIMGPVVINLNYLARILNAINIESVDLYLKPNSTVDTLTFIIPDCIFLLMPRRGESWHDDGPSFDLAPYNELHTLRAELAESETRLCFCHSVLESGGTWTQADEDKAVEIIEGKKS